MNWNNMNEKKCLFFKRIFNWKNRKFPSNFDYKNDFGIFAEQWSGHKDNYKQIIRVTESYIVYVTKANMIDWETTKGHDDCKAKDDKKEYEKALSQCSVTEHKPTYGLSEASLLSFKIIVGEAIVNCFEGNFQGSAEILTEADKYRVDRIIEKSREWYLSYTLFLTALTIFSVVVLNILDSVCSDEVLLRINYGAWAVAGACLSIILRSGQLQHASYAGKTLHFIESASHLVGGGISGLIAYFGIKSGIIFSSLITTENQQYIISLATLLSGASERFAPSIITKIENISSATDKAKDEVE